jgi:hypothetical protein
MFSAGEHGKCPSEFQMRNTANFSQIIYDVQVANPISSVNRTPVKINLKPNIA